MTGALDRGEKTALAVRGAMGKGECIQWEMRRIRIVNRGARNYTCNGHGLRFQSEAAEHGSSALDEA